MCVVLFFTFLYLFLSQLNTCACLHKKIANFCQTQLNQKLIKKDLKPSYGKDHPISYPYECLTRYFKGRLLRHHGTSLCQPRYDQGVHYV